VLLRDFASSEKTREKRRAFLREYLEAIEAESAAGNVRDFDPQVLTLALVGLCSTIANWYEPEGRLSREEIKKIYSGWPPVASSRSRRAPRTGAVAGSVCPGVTASFRMGWNPPRHNLQP
jgi:hypothetical protein